MISVNTHQAKTQLSHLLFEVENHHEIVRICRNGKPVAEIIPINKLIDPLQQYNELKNIKMHFDPTEPLTDDEWPSWSR